MTPCPSPTCAAKCTSGSSRGSKARSSRETTRKRSSRLTNATSTARSTTSQGKRSYSAIIWPSVKTRKTSRARSTTPRVWVKQISRIWSASPRTSSLSTTTQGKILLTQSVSYSNSAGVKTPKSCPSLILPPRPLTLLLTPLMPSPPKSKRAFRRSRAYNAVWAPLWVENLI